MDELRNLKYNVVRFFYDEEDRTWAIFNDEDNGMMLIAGYHYDFPCFYNVVRITKDVITLEDKYLTPAVKRKVKVKRLNPHSFYMNRDILKRNTRSIQIEKHD